MQLSIKKNFFLLHICNHLVALLGIYFLYLEYNIWYVFFGIIIFLYAGIIGVNVSLHRYFAHRSFETTPFLERILLFSTILTSLGSPSMWSSIHNLHHENSDTDKDPHNPRKIGIIRTWLTLWDPVHIPNRIIAPYIDTKEKRFLHKNYFTISFILILILVLIDIKLCAFLYSIPAIGCFHGAQTIGVLPHYFGYRRYNTNDESRNNWIASIISLGEGWHNNHHRYPNRWYQGETWWEFDPPAFFIKNIFATNISK